MLIDAKYVTIDAEDPDFTLVGFASDGRDPRQYLMLQRSRNFDEQDVATGMDNVYVERDDQRYSAYGGIRLFELRRNFAWLLLDAATARKLGNEAVFEVRFELEDERFEELRAGLARLFKGLGCFADLAT